jgi:O-antigen ligase
VPSATWSSVGVYVAPADLRSLRPPRAGPRAGGDLTWIAAAAVSAAALLAAIVLGSGTEFLATAAVIPFVVLFAIRPAWGVYAIIIVRPSMDLWADRSLANAGSHSVNPASALAVVFIAVGGAYLLENRRLVRQAPSTVPYIGLACMAALSIAVAPSPAGATTETLRLISVAVLYMAAWTVVRDREGLKRMVIALLASLIVPTALALWQFAHGGSTVIGEVGRSAGTFLQPDPFGIFMGFMAAFLIPLALCSRLRLRWAVLLATPFVLGALVASYTRTGWVGFLFGLFVLAVIRYRWMLVLGPILLILIAAAVPSTVHRFSDLTSGRTHYGPGNSLRARLDLWRQNLPRVEHDPVLGNGFKAIVEDTAGTRAVGVNVQQGAHSHSDFVRAIVELGVPGFVFFCWLLFGMWAACRRSYRRARDAGDQVLAALSLGSLVAASAYILMSFDSNLMTQVAVSGTFWAVAAVGHAAGRVELSWPDEQ